MNADINVKLKHLDTMYDGVFGLAVRAHQPVEMPRIAGAAWIEREVSLEIFEAGHERTIERGTQFVEAREHALLGVAFRCLQPGDEVAANLGNVLLVIATAHTRGAQAPGFVQLDAAFPQFGEQRRIDEVVSHTETAFGELIDQARRRGRSPVRLASGRRFFRAFFWRMVWRALWRAFSGLRRLALALGLAAFFFATAFLTTASSMEPRHFGDPQRQA